MKQGASRHKHADRGVDLYETPACATEALLRHADLPDVIWEPCAGRGAISRLLRGSGHKIIAQDLVPHAGADADITPGIDFLMEHQAPEGCDCIVTNPPYMLGNQFIRHGLSLGCDVIVLLRLMALEGAGRSDIIDHHLLRVYAGIERLPFMHRDGWKGKKNSNSGAPFAWFHFTANERLKGYPIQLHMEGLMKRAELTQDQLKHVLRYEPDTGTFYWRVRQANCVHVGQVAGSIRKCGYCVIGIGNRTFKAHRLAWLYVVGDLPPGIVIDHINNDPSDNRIANLRVASVAQNKRNERIRSDNTSSFKGVAFDPRSGKWRARIGIGGKRICLGRHDDPRQAYEAYCRAAISTFGEFARLA